MSYSSRAHLLVNSGLVNHDSTSHHVGIQTLINILRPNINLGQVLDLAIFSKLKIFEIHTKTDAAY